MPTSTGSAFDPMVQAVSDTGPINYLILTDYIDLLPRLFGQVRIARVVRDELGNTKAPAVVRNWIAASPSWLSVEVADVKPIEILPPLDDGERATIALAKHIAADAVLMDDRAGVAVARSLGFVVVGTLGLLVSGARGGFVDLPSAFARLRATSFHGSRELFDGLLAKHRDDGRR